jgi:adenosylmethionine-8-amino-7-oxononanoate aminotransferase
VELHEPANVTELQPQFVEQGIWVRPFGKIVYLMPPFIITEQELHQLTDGIYHVLSRMS